MVFHESLNPERNFSLAIPLVFIAILGGTTGVVGLATVLSPDSSYAVSPQAQLASPVQTMTTPVATKSAPIGSDEDMCKAGHMYEVTIGSDASAKTEDVGTKVDCEAKDAQGKKINQSNEMCSKGKEGKGYGNLKYKLSSGTSRDTLCYPGEDPKTLGLAAAARDLGPSDARRNLIGAMANDPKQMADVANTLGTMRDDTSRQLESCYSGSGDCVGPLNYVQGERMKLSNTKDALEEIREYGIEPTIPPPKTPTPGDYQGENPGAIDAALKNSASYLGPTSPGLSQSDLLGTPLSELNGRYKYGELTVSTDGKTYTVWEEGQRAAIVEKVGDGQTIGDVIAAKQYEIGPESPYQSSRDTFAANVVAQGEVPYSSARGTPEQTDTSAFDKWSAGLPGANIQGPAYDFSSDALDPGVAKAAGDAKGDWTKDFSFNCETAGAGASVLDTPLGNLPQGETKIGDNITVLRDGNNISIQDTGLNPSFAAPVDISRLGNTVGDVVGSFQGNNSPISNASTYGKNVELLGETPYSVGASDYAVSGNWTYGPGDAEAYSAENLQKQLDTTQAKLDAASAQMPRAELNALVAERNKLQGMIDQSKPYAAAENFEKAFCQNSVEPGCNGVPKTGDNTDVPLPKPRPEVKVDVPLPRPAVRDVSNSLYAIENKAFGGEALTPAEQKVWDNYDKQVLETKAFGGEALTPSEQKRLDEYNAAPKPGDGADTGGKGEVPKANTPPVPGVECAGSSRGCTPTAKAPVDPNGNQTGSGKTGAGDPTKDNSGSGSGIGSALSSMLQGLMKALGAPQPTPPAPSQPCSADPNIYAQQQQQYQQQLQQYNYQMQQQQYQQQVNQYYADRNGTTPPPVQPLPPQPSACTPSTGSQCRE